MSLSENIYVRLHKVDFEAIHKLSEKKGMKMSYIVREIIREYFEKHSKKKLW